MKNLSNYSRILILTAIVCIIVCTLVGTTAFVVSVLQQDTSVAPTVKQTVPIQVCSEPDSLQIVDPNIERFNYMVRYHTDLRCMNTYGNHLNMKCANGHLVTYVLTYQIESDLKGWARLRRDMVKNYCEILND